MPQATSLKLIYKSTTLEEINSRGAASYLGINSLSDSIFLTYSQKSPIFED